MVSSDRHTKNNLGGKGRFHDKEHPIPSLVDQVPNRRFGDGVYSPRFRGGAVLAPVEPGADGPPPDRRPRSWQIDRSKLR